MGFDIDLSIDEFETREERDDFRKDITVAFNNYLKGNMEWCGLCDATYCYDEDDLGPSIACHLYVLEYLIKKGII